MRAFGILLAFSLFGFAQTPVPTINDGGIVRGDTNRPGILSPGIAFGIWGHNYGPQGGCNGPAAEICGVQVLLDGVPIEVQYANDVQINARMPEATSVPALSRLVVVSGGRRSAPVEVRRLPEVASISLDGIARVSGPIWIHVELPRMLRVSYPAMAFPWDFACDELEVRKDGKAIAPISHPALGMGYSGPSCPGNASPGGRLPLHLQFDLKVPGMYEVRLLHYGSFARRRDDVRIQSEWTPIEVLPVGTVKPIASHPQEPDALVRDFLPNLLARRDDEALGLLLEYLYHASPRVRSYAADALYYWPDDVVEKRLLETLHANGPSPAVVQRLHTHAAEIAELAIPYFFSDDPLLFQGAIAAARVALSPQEKIDAQVRARVEERLIAAATGNISRADGQTANDIVALLGQIHTERVRDLLWDFADRHVHAEQALICITWQKDTKDLPRLTEYLLAEPADNKSGALSSMAYALHNSYGDAALPSLRTILEKSQIMFLRTAVASELMRANDAAGFAFASDAIEHDRAWKREMRNRVSEQFPDTRNDTDAGLIAFLTLKSR